jgi:TetR/AcrR family transcriptional regulator
MEKIDKKREDILDAAMYCLARYGMVKSTLEDIAHRVGMNKATLYYYYKNKEAIFVDALEREGHRFFERACEKFKMASSVAEKVILLVKAYHEHFRNRAEFFELDATAMIDNHTLIQKLHQHFRTRNVDFMADIIQEGIDTGEFNDLDATHTADIIRTILDTRRLEIYSESTTQRDSKINYRKLEKESLFIIELFLNGIRKKKSENLENTVKAQ